MQIIAYLVFGAIVGFLTALFHGNAVLRAIGSGFTWLVMKLNLQDAPTRWGKERE